MPTRKTTSAASKATATKPTAKSSRAEKVVATAEPVKQHRPPGVGPGYGFKKGDPRINRKGREKGSTNKFVIQQAREAAKSGYTPLEFMLAIMRSEPEQLKSMNINPKSIRLPMRHDAAKNAAPYVHRKMPIGIDNGQGGPIGFYTADQLAKLSDEELEKLSTILGRLAVMGVQPGELPNESDGEGDG